MEKTNLLIVAAIALVIGLLTTYTVSADGLDCPICDVDLSDYAGELDEGESEGLLLALNDEYHAWAVYDQVLADFGDVRPFSQIKQSEETHIAALVELFEAYDVPVPENPWVGNVPSFDSVEEAAAVGVQAEIDNAALYDVINASTDREDILAVYESLQRASEENHLPAFQRVVDRGTGDSGQGQSDGSDRGNGNGRGRGQGVANRGDDDGEGDRVDEPAQGRGNRQGAGNSNGAGADDAYANQGTEQSAQAQRASRVQGLWERVRSWFGRGQD